MGDNIKMAYGARRIWPPALVPAAKALFVGILCGLAATAAAQLAVSRDDMAALPDDPGLLPSLSITASPTAPLSPYLDVQAGMPQPVAKKTEKYIPGGWQAEPLGVGGKIDLTLHDLYTPQSFVGFALAAGYSHLVNGQPNFGVNDTAFAQRLGAAAARDTSQDLFEGAVFAPLLHEDPRYYVEGDRYGVAHRTLYAITRPLIRRNDQGRERVNGSLLLGYAAAAALTNAYYPAMNRNASDTAKTYGASIGGAALGFTYHEFLGDALHVLHLQKRQEP